MNAYDKALSFLAVREHTAKEIRAKLSQRGFCQDEIEEAVKRLIAENAISDGRFIEALIRSSLKKGESAAFIRLKLLEKGVDRKKAEEAVRILKESSEYEESVKKAVLRMMEKKEEGKALSSLARKGYSMAEIRNALKGDC